MSTQKDILILRIGDKNFALPLKDVSHILEAGKINILPGVKESPAIGIITTRGKAVIVVDAKTIVTGEEKSPDKQRHGKIVILRDDKIRLGLYIGNIEPTFLYKDTGVETIARDSELIKVEWKKLYEEVELSLREKINE